MLAEDLVLVFIGEPLAKSRAGRAGSGPTSRAWPPPGRGREGALAADGALGVGDGAALLPRRRRRQQVGEARRVGVGRHLGDHQQLAAAQGLAHPVAVRQETAGWCRAPRARGSPPGAPPRTAPPPCVPARAPWSGSARNAAPGRTRPRQSPCGRRAGSPAPTSRPPMAFGCPRHGEGSRPGLPMRPHIRWALRMVALALSTPGWTG